ncbi:MAG TPA: ATP-dependent DNA helicase [Patescibacteria group bacterium]|nr:ATP-dependent DNA helicase [Patescibacteria group bacterium]
MPKDSSEKKLNKEQIDAIKFGDGPLLIIAGAGTGKTTVITERVKHLIMTGKAKPEEILALTFTEKGAREMEERIDVAMPYGYTQMWVMTFHSFCDQILRDNAIHIGLSPTYKLMTTAQSIDLIRKNLFELDLDYFRPLGNPNKFIDGLLNHFSRLQDECVSPTEYISWVNSKHKSRNPKQTIEEKLEIQKAKELASAHKKYNELKIKENVMDFGDLITNTIKLFKERPNILKIYQGKFKYVLIDEFQDTNFAQNQLAIMLAGKNQNITVVGDDDQSIYRFRGAAISNIIQFRKHFPKTKVVVLTKNYRSTQEILDRSYDLIQHNNPDRLEVVEKISKKLVAETRNKKQKIKFIHTETAGDEAREVIKTIIQLASKDKHEYKDIAILVRANNHSDPFIREMERQGIPNQFLGPSNLFEKEEIMDLISYLKVLYNPNDSESFYRLLSSDIFNISPIDLIKISSHAKKTSLSIFEVVTESDPPSHKATEGQVQIKKILELINKHLKLIKKQTAGEILYDYINEVGLLQKLVENSEDIKAKNIAKFFEKIKAYEDSNKNAGVTAVVDYIDLLIEVGESPNVTDGDWQENNAVNILTVHSSKGLEFPIVFLANLVGERFPGRERHEQIPIPAELIKEVLPMGDFHLQEERRLFYVGMTRAKEKLYFSAADFYGEAKRKKKISPFVYEALGEISNIETRNPKQIPNLKIQNPKLEINKEENKKIKIDYLSVSQIETFQTCPLHYKLKYIYKLPTKPSASSSFGISIHETLKEFYQEMLLSPTSPKASRGSSERLIEIYKKSFLEDGYLNKKHKQEFFKKGESYLLGFIKNGYDKQSLSLHDKKIKTILLEEKFVMPIDTTLKIGGTIDRVDDLGNGKIEIIDYKTGANIPTQKEVDKDLQLSFYALAISNIKKIKPENIKLSLYYLDNQEKITTNRTTSQLEKVKEEILAIREEIENSDFKCNNNFFCQGKCEYSMFCKSDS